MGRQSLRCLICRFSVTLLSQSTREATEMAVRRRTQPTAQQGALPVEDYRQLRSDKGHLSQPKQRKSVGDGFELKAFAWGFINMGRDHQFPAHALSGTTEQECLWEIPRCMAPAPSMSSTRWCWHEPLTSGIWARSYRPVREARSWVSGRVVARTRWNSPSPLRASSWCQPKVWLLELGGFQAGNSPVSAERQPFPSAARRRDSFGHEAFRRRDGKISARHFGSILSIIRSKPNRRQNLAGR